MDDAVKPSILLVDDDDVLRGQLERAFKRRGYEVRAASGRDEALELARPDSPELAVLDLRMPDGSGLELLRDLLQLDPTTRAVILTGYGSIATAVEAIKLGAVNYVPKPAGIDDILAAFERSDTPLEPATRDFDPPSLARAEWEHMQRVLSDCGGNVSEAARRLGMHRRSLQRKLQKYPPSW